MYVYENLIQPKLHLESNANSIDYVVPTQHIKQSFYKLLIRKLLQTAYNVTM